MAQRYETASDKINDLLRHVIADKFISLSGSLIHVIMGTKKRMKGGNLVIAEIKKPSALMKYLFGTADGELDYIIVMDELCETLPDIDIKRIIFHELEHTDVDTDSDNPYKLRGHEIEGFYSELTYNEDDPKWSERIATTFISIRESQE